MLRLLYVHADKYWCINLSLFVRQKTEQTAVLIFFNALPKQLPWVRGMCPEMYMVADDAMLST